MTKAKFQKEIARAKKSAPGLLDRRRKFIATCMVENGQNFKLGVDSVYSVLGYRQAEIRGFEWEWQAFQDFARI